jgi:two-component SAPR family response regulator
MADATDPLTSSGGTRVLIVEDEAVISLTLKQILNDHGYHVLGPAPTVEDALRLLAQELPDLALLDVNLRGELVTPVANKLGSCGVPFVLVTGYELAELSLELRQSLWVPKPIVEDVLVRTMAGALQRPGSSRQA